MNYQGTRIIKKDSDWLIIQFLKYLPTEECEEQNRSYSQRFLNRILTLVDSYFER